MWRSAIGVLTCTAACAQNCNVFRNVPKSLSIYSRATPYITLNYHNDCLHPVVVTNDFTEVQTSPPLVYVPAQSTYRQRLRCATPNVNFTGALTADNGETAQITIECLPAPFSASTSVFAIVPSSGYARHAIPVIGDASNITASYLPFPVARVTNGNPISGEPKCPTSNAGLVDIRRHFNYTGLFEFDQESEFINYATPFLNSVYGWAVEVLRAPVVIFDRLRTTSMEARPEIPNSDIFSFISAFWTDYWGIGEVGYVVSDDNVLTVQWSDLDLFDGEVMTVQIILKPNGDHAIRSGLCQGDLRNFLADAVTGYQATDPSRQVMFAKYEILDPCNAALYCELSDFRVEYVEQEVSDWITPAGQTASTVDFQVAPITSGTLVSPSQGQIQLSQNGVLYQGTDVFGIDEI